MAKSVRSKFKKKQKAIRKKNLHPQLEARVGDLNGKLQLCAEGGISKVPHQKARPEFSHRRPHHVQNSGPISLKPFTTNVHKGLRGYEGPSGPHPQRVNQPVLPDTILHPDGSVIPRAIVDGTASSSLEAAFAQVAPAPWELELPGTIEEGDDEDGADDDEVPEVIPAEEPAKKTTKLLNADQKKRIANAAKKMPRDVPEKTVKKVVVKKAVRKSK